MKKLLLSLVAALAVSLTSCANNSGVKPAEKNEKVLIAYFSATGNTARAAREIADVTGGTLHEIEPEKKYSAADLDWNDHQSRCYVEMHNLKFRPALKEKKTDLAAYDVIYIGFPIWWNIAPTIINTFIESNDLSGKTVIPFATSGGSTIDNSAAQLRKAYPKLKWGKAKLLNGASEDDIRNW